MIGPAPRPRIASFLVALFLLLLGLWLAAFALSGGIAAGPSGTRMDGDLAMFLAGARAVSVGENPYDQAALYRNEAALLVSHRIALPPPQSFVRVGSPPILFWVLQPVARLPFRTVGVIWSLTLYLTAACGFLLLLRAGGWTRRLAPLTAFLAMPQTVLGAYYGNVDALIFAAVAGALVCARRHPVLAGACLSLGLLKPQIGLPAVVLVALFHSPARVKTMAACVAVAAGAMAASVALTGPKVALSWLFALTGYSRGLSSQPEIASLSGLFSYCAGPVVTLALNATLVLVALTLTLWWMRRMSVARLLRGTAVHNSIPSHSAWLWIVWFLATPYAHFHDEIMLAVPIAAILGVDAGFAGRPAGLVALYGMLGGLILFPASRFHTDFQSLALLPVLAASLFHARGPGRRTFVAGDTPAPALPSAERSARGLPARLLSPSVVPLMRRNSWRKHAVGDAGSPARNGGPTVGSDCSPGSAVNSSTTIPIGMET